MDASSWGLIMATAINSVIFTILFILFACYRKYRSKHIDQSITDEPVHNPPIDESVGSLCETLGKVWAVQRSEIATKVGVQAGVYLNLLYYMALIVLLMAVISWGALVPLYILADGDVNNEVELTGISSAFVEADYLWSPLVVLLVFSVFGEIFLMKFIAQSVAQAQVDESDISVRTVQAWGIDKQHLAQVAQGKVLEAFRARFGDGVLEAVTLPEYSEAYKHFALKSETQKQLTHWNEYKQVKNEEPLIKVKCKKVPAISHCENLIETENQAQQTEMESHKSENTGFAFIIFKSKEDAEYAISEKAIRINELSNKALLLQPAPSPQEINWQNLNVDQRKAVYSRCCLTTTFVLIFLFLLTPTMFLVYAQEALSQIGVPDVISSLIGGYLPTILILIYMSVILPMTINFLVKKQRHSSKVNETLSAISMYLIFMIVHIFLSPMLGMQAFEFVQILIDGDYGELKQTMANRMTAAGGTFTTLLIQFAFITNGFDLLQAGKLIGVKLKQRNAVNDKERSLAFECPEFNFPYEYGVAINAFTIIISFSIVFPVILLLGLIFLTLRYHIHKYNLLCVFITQESASVKRIAQSVSNAIATAGLLFQILTTVVLMLSEEDEMVFLALGLFVVSIGFAVFKYAYLIDRYINKPYVETVVAPVTDDRSEGQPLKEASYKHPLEQQFQKFYISQH